MEMWEWLRPWWNWWAGWTDLFDWQAIGAMGTGMAVVAALAATVFQEWRVQRRVELSERALHKGAVDTVRQGWIAVDEAREVFFPAGNVDRDRVGKVLRKVERARRLTSLFVAREVDPVILVGLLQMDDHLEEAASVLSRAHEYSFRRVTENAEFNGQLDEAASAAQLLFISLA